MNLLEALSIEGSSDSVILIYAIVSKKEAAQRKAHFKGWAVTEQVTPFVLENDEWPNSIFLLEKKYAHAAVAPSDIVALVEKLHAQADCKAILGMFDGAFVEYQDLFSPELAEQIYCFSTLSGHIVMAFDDDIRIDKAWAAAVDKQKKLVN